MLLYAISHQQPRTPLVIIVFIVFIVLVALQQAIRLLGC